MRFPQNDERSRRWERPKGLTEPIQLNLNALVFNVATATCGNCCFFCNGINSITVTANPFACPVSETVQLKATGNWNTGMTTDETGRATWSSSSTAIATVSNTSGSKGLVSGLAAGSCTITALENVNIPGRACDFSNPNCPEGNRSGSSDGTVTAKAQISGVSAKDSTINTLSMPTSTTVTITIFHEDTSKLTNPIPSVEVQLNTFNSTPIGNNVSISPPQTISLAGASPALATFTVSVSPATVTGSVTLQASLTNPSSNVTVSSPSPASRAQVTITTTTN